MNTFLEIRNNDEEQDKSKCFAVLYIHSLNGKYSMRGISKEEDLDK